MSKSKYKVGRPTTYDKKYCQMIVDFFDRDHTKQVCTGTDIDGKKIMKTVANELPLFTSFAYSIGTVRDTLNEWVHVHKDFSAAHKIAYELQESMLVDNTIHNLYAQPGAIFTMKNLLRWTDRSEIIETKFIFQYVGLITEVINKTMPDFCPHCKKPLKLREETIRQLEEVSRNMEIGKHQKKQYDDK